MTQPTLCPYVQVCLTSGIARVKLSVATKLAQVRIIVLRAGASVICGHAACFIADALVFNATSAFHGVE